MVPLIVGAAIGALVEAAGSIVGRVLISAGIGIVSYEGMSALQTKIAEMMWNRLNGLPGQFVGLLGILHIGACLNILFSAYLARAVLSGLNGGAMKRWVTK